MRVARIFVWAKSVGGERSWSGREPACQPTILKEKKGFVAPNLVELSFIGVVRGTSHFSSDAAESNNRCFCLQVPYG